MYYTIDRFEGNIAVLQSEGKQMQTVERALLPADAKEGDVLKEENGRYLPAPEKQAETAARIREKMKSLWKE